jgi:LAO/AO transport system kinase
MSQSGRSEQEARRAAIARLQEAKKEFPSAEKLASAILGGDHQALSRGITLAESQNAEQKEQARRLIAALYPHAGGSQRIGITGVPGVGKSTFIEAFGMHLVEKGNKVAVLAIDPSSQHSGGSILGDKTRMEKLAAHPNTFIRPSPAAKSLGGVARATREAMILCEAAGFDIVLIETVGVGQSETAVHSMTDFFLLLMLAGAGDELQGIKRGIMEMADAIAITKADGDNVKPAQQAMQSYKNALHLFPPSQDGWMPKVGVCSAIKKEGLDEIAEWIDQHHRKLTLNGMLSQKRKDQAVFWFNEALNELWREKLFKDEKLYQRKKELEESVKNGSSSPFEAAAELISHLH